MDVTLGFIAILLLIFFPGLIFRRLYFYGEFSKQFNPEKNLVNLLAKSSIPGLILLVLIFLFYDKYVIDIDLGKIIDKFKDVTSQDFRYSETTEKPIKLLVNEYVLPFLEFLYFSSGIIGILLSRLVRYTKLDTRFKLLRFKNQWFYIFTDQFSDFKKNRHLKERNKKHVFTKADIQIETAHENIYYSGIVVDYELLPSDSSVLSKVVLRKAVRTENEDPDSNEQNNKGLQNIAGKYLVVDCKSMKSINLSYVYEKPKPLLKTKIPNIVIKINSILVIILLPFFIFKSDFIHAGLYNSYFELSWISKIFAYLFVIQAIGLINPFRIEDDEYKYVNWKTIIVKLLFLGVFYILMISL